MLEKSGGIMRLTRSLIWAGASHTQGQMILMDAKDQLTANAMMAKIPRRTQRSRPVWQAQRSEEHTSELQSLMRISYAVFCLKKKKQNENKHLSTQTTTNRINR